MCFIHFQPVLLKARIASVKMDHFLKETGNKTPTTLIAADTDKYKPDIHTRTRYSTREKDSTHLLI